MGDHWCKKQWIIVTILTILVDVYMPAAVYNNTVYNDSNALHSSISWLRHKVDSRGSTLFHSIASLTCLTVELFVLLALAVWLYLLSSCQQSPTGLFRLSVQGSGTIYRLMWRLLSRCLHSASSWKPISLQNHCPAISWTLNNHRGQ